MFLGYSTNSRAYRVYNLKTQTIQESVNVVFDDSASLKDNADHLDVSSFVEDCGQDSDVVQDGSPENVQGQGNIPKEQSTSE